MANLNVQSSLPTPSVTASIAPNNSEPDTQGGKSFGDVLKQQVNESSSNNPTVAKSTPLADKKIKDEKDILSNNTKDGIDLAATLAAQDLSANMIALLQPLQETRAPTSANISVGDMLGKADPKKHVVVGVPTNQLSANNEKRTLGAAVIKPDPAALNAKQIDAKQMSADLVKFTDSSSVPTLADKAPVQLPEAQTIALQNPTELLNVNFNAIAANTDVSRNSISTPLGNTGWADEFSQKISWMTTSQLDQVAELHLNPPNLGPLDVVLKISDNQATATFTSAHSAVREAVENAMPKLREILADNGITLGNTTVSDQPPRDGNASAFNGQQSNPQSGRSIAHNSDDTLVSTPISVSLNTGIRHNGMVDTFA